MLELTIIHRAFLELIKISIGTSNADFDFSLLTDDDWNRVIDESKKQATVLLCFDALKNVEYKPKSELYNRWFLMSAANLKNNIRVINEQEFLINLLNDNNIPYVILKGSSSACYYPDSKIRSLGDVDFIVDSSYLDKTKELILGAGYELDDNTSPVHLEFSRNKVRIELHKTISGIPNNKYGAAFSKEIPNFTENSVLEYGYFRPCDFHHAIVIFLHTLHHLLNNGIGIRHLCDWACFVNRTKQDAFWEERFIPLLKKTGTFKFMCGLTATAAQLLGIEMPTWCVSVPENMVDTLIYEIVSSGNFGRKKSKQYSLIMTRMDSGKSSVFSKIRGMLNALNKTNHLVCPIIKKIPIIYPFVMIYRIVRYLILMFMGKKPSLIETSRYADERSAVFRNYQLYNIEDDK